MLESLVLWNSLMFQHRHLHGFCGAEKSTVHTERRDNILLALETEANDIGGTGKPSSQIRMGWHCAQFE